MQHLSVINERCQWKFEYTRGKWELCFFNHVVEFAGREIFFGSVVKWSTVNDFPCAWFSMASWLLPSCRQSNRAIVCETNGSILMVHCSYQMRYLYRCKLPYIKIFNIIRSLFLSFIWIDCVYCLESEFQWTGVQPGLLSTYSSTQ
jgi:hypothetical protein